MNNLPPNDYEVLRTYLTTHVKASPETDEAQDAAERLYQTWGRQCSYIEGKNRAIQNLINENEEAHGLMQEATKQIRALKLEVELAHGSVLFWRVITGFSIAIGLAPFAWSLFQ